MTDTPPAFAPAATAPNRRDVLAGGAGFLAAIAGLSLLARDARAADAPRPHILYIMADDLGFADVGFHGSDIRTPNLDRLAAGGARFGQFYTQPMCTPTRAALMTGRYPLRYGLQTGVIPSGADYGLATDEFLLPQALKQAGYRTALVGKWHLGHADRKYWPRQRGFDSFYGPLVGEIDHFKHEAHGVTDWYRDNELLKEDGYDTELFGAEAVRLIGGHDPAVPLFLYLAFTAPHTPYQAPQRYLDMYASIADPARRAYAAMITAMDDQIGRVIAALEARGMRANTLTVFHSDNGGTRNLMFAGEGAVAGDLPPNNTPYREGKGTLYEGGTRVVALANWPGHIEAGETTGVMHVVDMLPTLARLAGATLATTKPLDGRDVWPALALGQSGRDAVVYNVEPTQGAVREGKWKLVWHVVLPPKAELFDLDADPSETTDLAERHPDKVAALQAKVVDLARNMAPPLFYAAALKATLSAPLATPGAALYEMGLEND
ncbi:arylsulfatase [Ancylobacter sp. WKF20]|uniref:arylsulfatase B n=1 Tax=Ancylobacter sp. WKF20 TaxID=3039801 RepID=UPI0024344AE4|nr:arylsulfatase [Ancylobacter sp. WKF20]WGD30578.1 arylsulfatase [Ancylobacter sp. WKF20]